MTFEWKGVIESLNCRMSERPMKIIAIFLFLLLKSVQFISPYIYNNHFASVIAKISKIVFSHTLIDLCCKFSSFGQSFVCINSDDFFFFISSHKSKSLLTVIALQSKFINSIFVFSDVNAQCNWIGCYWAFTEE